MSVCVYIYIYTYIHTYVHIQMHTCIVQHAQTQAAPRPSWFPSSLHSGLTTTSSWPLWAGSPSKSREPGFDMFPHSFCADSSSPQICSTSFVCNFTRETISLHKSPQFSAKNWEPGLRPCSAAFTNQFSSGCSLGFDIFLRGLCVGPSPPQISA